MTSFSAQWDQLTISELRRRGSMKWTMTSKYTGMPLDGAWVAEGDFGTAPAVTAAVKDALACGRLGYIPTALPKRLQQACAAFQAERFDWQIDPDYVIPTPNVLFILNLMIAELTQPNAGVIVPTPAYMPFLTIPGMFGRRTIEVPSVYTNNHWQLDFDAISAAAAAGAELLILCNPWNPTGRALNREELAEVAKIVDNYGIFVFVDEIHSPLILPGYQHLPFAREFPELAARTVTATAASKAFNIPGLKSATAVITDPQIRSRLYTGLASGREFMPPVGMEASAAAYESGGEWLDEARQYIAENVAMTHAAVTEAGFDMARPEATYLTWWDVRRPDGGRILDEYANVMVNEGITLGREWGNFIRFNTATARPVLLDMVQRCLRALADH